MTQTQTGTIRQYRPINDFLGACAIALTAAIMAHAGMFGAAPIVIFYAVWLPFIFLRGTSIVMPSRDTLPCLAFCGLAIVSAAWSDYPSVSLYSSLEYTSLVICTIIMSRVLSNKAWLTGLAGGSAVILLASIFSGVYAADPFSPTPALVGLFSSKNQVGLFAELGILCAVILLTGKFSRLTKLVYGIVPLLIGLKALVASKSASSIISLAGVIGVLAMVWLVTRLPRKYRGFALIAAFFTAGILAVVVLITGLDEVVLQSFGKDSTLTGRTYLWGEGIKAGMEHPMLGDGYAAFWVAGRPLAEQFWYQFGVLTKIGFHFHDLYVQSFVDLGIFGLLAVIGFMVGNCYVSFRLIVRHGMQPLTVFLLGLSIMLLIRSVVEVDVIGTFAIGPLLLYSIIPRAYRYDKLQQRRQAETGPA